MRPNLHRVALQLIKGVLPLCRETTRTSVVRTILDSISAMVPSEASLKEQMMILHEGANCSVQTELIGTKHLDCLLGPAHHAAETQ